MLVSPHGLNACSSPQSLRGLAADVCPRRGPPTGAWVRVQSSPARQALAGRCAAKADIRTDGLNNRSASQSRPSALGQAYVACPHAILSNSEFVPVPHGPGQVFRGGRATAVRPDRQGRRTLSTRPNQRCYLVGTPRRRPGRRPGQFTEAPRARLREPSVNLREPCGARLTRCHTTVSMPNCPTQACTYI